LDTVSLRSFTSNNENAISSSQTLLSQTDPSFQKKAKTGKHELKKPGKCPQIRKKTESVFTTNLHNQIWVLHIAAHGLGKCQFSMTELSFPTMQSENHALGVFNHNKEDKGVNNQIPK
jgi:hypothetical protein